MAEQYPNEQWRPVVGCEGWYEVSDLGQVKRVKGGMGTTFGHVLVPSSDRKGYSSVCLRHPGRRSKQRTLKVHRLVLAAFVGPCPAGLQVNHKNGVKTDNRLSNLEYVTPKENTHHACTVLGHDRRGENHSHAKLTDDAVRGIRRRYKAGGVTLKQLATKYGVDRSAIWRVTACRNWRHLL